MFEEKRMAMYSSKGVGRVFRYMFLGRILYYISMWTLKI